jgi:hypothetical protein
MNIILRIIQCIIKTLNRISDWIEWYMRKKDDKIIAFIDLLGFKNYLLKGNPLYAYILLNDFHSALAVKFQDQELPQRIGHKITQEKTEFLNAAIGITSFDEYLPFSDSVFIASTNPDLFILQLSSLLLDAFMFTSDAFNRELTAEEITKVTVRYPAVNSDGHVEIKEEEEVRYPILLRGGIVMGEAKVAEIPAIRDGIKSKNTTLVGPGVVYAYELEELHLKGPRMICDKTFVQSVNDETAKSLILPIEGSQYYEILWPAAYYFDASNDADIKNKIHTLLLQASNLWIAFRHLEYGVHYYQFVKLIVRSTINYFKNSDKYEIIIKMVEDEIDRCSLSNYKQDLLK